MQSEVSDADIDELTRWIWIKMKEKKATLSGARVSGVEFMVLYFVKRYILMISFSTFAYLQFRIDLFGFITCTKRLKRYFHMFFSCVTGCIDREGVGWIR